MAALTNNHGWCFHKGSIRTVPEISTQAKRTGPSRRQPEKALIRVGQRGAPVRSTISISGVGCPAGNLRINGLLYSALYKVGYVP